MGGILNFRASKLTHAELAAVLEGDVEGAIALDITGSQVGDKGVGLVAASKKTGALRALWLDDTGAGDAGAAALATSSTLKPRELYYAYNELTAVGVQILLGGGLLSNAEILRLTYNAIGDAGARHIARSASLGKLQHLALAGCGLTDAGAKALFGSKTLVSLQELDLGGNKLTSAALGALADPSILPALQSLTVGAGMLDEATAESIRSKRPGLELN